MKLWVRGAWMVVGGLVFVAVWGLFHGQWGGTLIVLAGAVLLAALNLREWEREAGEPSWNEVQRLVEENKRLRGYLEERDGGKPSTPHERLKPE